jgi:hypothetical protein
MAPPPVALGLTLCDYVIIEEGTKKASLLGSFMSLRARRFPAVAQPFSAFAVLTDGLGDVTLELTVVHAETNELIFRRQDQWHFPDKLAQVRYHARLLDCRFSAPGSYQFTLLANGQWVAQQRLRVYLVEDQP